MISGIGVDIIEVERVKKFLEKTPRALKKVFTPNEASYCLSKRHKYQHLAARFAAKEAFFKALGKKIQWTDVELVNLPTGKPELSIKGKERLSFSRSHVSISHLTEYAVAVVILEE